MGRSAKALAPPPDDERAERLRRYRERIDADYQRRLELDQQARIQQLERAKYFEQLHDPNEGRCELCYTFGWRWIVNGAWSYTGPWRGYPLRVLWEPRPDYSYRGLSEKGRAIWRHARAEDRKRTLQINQGGCDAK